MEIEFELYPSLFVTCEKISDNYGNIKQGEVFEGYTRLIPRKYVRFIVGGFNTNIVAKILTRTDEGGTFLTISGSIYKWQIVKTDGNEIDKGVIEIPEKTIKRVNDFVAKYDNINKLIDKL